jgi:hypothetical protein
VGFEPTIPASERAKKFHALDRTATVIGNIPLCAPKIVKERGAKTTQDDMNAEKGDTNGDGLLCRWELHDSLMIFKGKRKK